jgi:hypothetical protein
MGWKGVPSLRLFLSQNHFALFSCWEFDIVLRCDAMRCDVSCNIPVSFLYSSLKPLSFLVLSKYNALCCAARRNTKGIS